MKTLKYLPQLLLAVGALSMVACATPDKSPLAADADPRVELSRLQEDQKEAQTQQYDRLSPENFKKSEKYSAKAAKAAEKNKSREDIVENIEISRRYLEKANAVGEKYSAMVTPILEARRRALDAGAQRWVKSAFEKTDKDFADLGEDMEDNDFTVKASVISGLEDEYRTHEMESVKIASLDETRKNLERAESDGARRYAPKTLEMTRAMITSAERAVESSPRDPAGYQEKTQQAGEQAQKLREVLALAKSRGANESVALTIWEQNKQLQASQMQMQQNQQMSAERQAELQSELSAQQAALNAQGQRLTASEQRAQTLAQQEALRAKIEELRTQFGDDEAEVVKQGNNLVIRLKKMDFAVGKSEVPSSSFELLKKIQDVIAAVPAQNIVVEGHTDSTGSKQINEKLSQARADSVKSYFENQAEVEAPIEAKGFGADRPLTTNKTKEGRATNRRVDVVVETSTLL
ncbi:MAG: OmpA family protein [Bdellovibrionaceae bacterium]|nr:OmpA family protein [Pseudobdellovibrionaceae bacterium]